jgi:hypothetical protein
MKIKEIKFHLFLIVALGIEVSAQLCTPAFLLVEGVFDSIDQEDLWAWSHSGCGSINKISCWELNPGYPVQCQLLY